MATPTTKLSTLCSLLTASMFAYSASVQLNDPDWYFWFPLYACACIANRISWTNSSKLQCNSKAYSHSNTMLGMFLFIKVVIEDFVSGFWSLDLTERAVREKIGSGLVVISMILHLEASLVHKQSNKELARYIKYGMGILVGFSFGLPLVFFVVQKGEMKFGLDR